jgi:hypothetical protein
MKLKYGLIRHIRRLQWMALCLRWWIRYEWDLILSVISLITALVMISLSLEGIVPLLSGVLISFGTLLLYVALSIREHLSYDTTPPSMQNPCREISLAHTHYGHGVIDLDTIRGSTMISRNLHREWSIIAGMT